MFNASTCGDNCAKWILKPAEADDLTINLRYLMNFGEGAFEKGYPNVVLYLPESFEWIILRSEVIEDNVIVEMLKHPEDYIERKDFFSWKRYFRVQVVLSTQSIYLKYSKRQ